MDSGSADLDRKKTKALAVLRESDRWIVALSGGVDSAVLLDLAVQAVGAGAVTAATATSAAVPKKDVRIAAEVASRLGVEHRLVPTRELERPDYRANRGDRCFHCRDELFSRLTALLATAEGSTRLAYGAIADDVGDDRPGMRAAESHGVVAPLLIAGFSKNDVRGLARARALPVAERPANACLASRLPVGTEVTIERLDRIERAEQALEALGLRGFRVRDHGDLARIELPAPPNGEEGSVELLAGAGRRRVVAALREAGFTFVTLDLEGYRPGGRPLAAQRTTPERRGGQ